MSTITFVNAGANATGNNVSVQPGLPAGMAVDDLMLIHASIRNSGTGTPNQPTGWVTLASFGNEAIFARFNQAGDTMPTVSFTGGVAGADTLASSAAFRGVSKEVLLQLTASATQLNAASVNIAYPGLTVPKDRHLVLFAAWMQGTFTATNIAPPTTLQIGSLATSAAGSGAGQFWRYVVQTAAANVTSGTVTMTGSTSQISRAMLLALKPAATVTVTPQDVYPPRNLIAVTDLTIGDSVYLYRSVAGVRTLVQGASSVAVTDPSFLRIDATLPFGVPVSYVAVVNGVEYTTAAATYTLTGGKVAVSDAISGLAAEVVIWAWPEKTRNRRATVFQPGGRNVVVMGRLSLPSADVELYTDAYSSTENLVELLENATQGVVQIRQPGGYEGVDGFYAVTSYRERRYSQDGSDEKRIHILTLVEVDGWAGAFTALGFTYGDLATIYTGLTYANLSADFATYLLLSQGDFS